MKQKIKLAILLAGLLFGVILVAQANDSASKESVQTQQVQLADSSNFTEENLEPVLTSSIDNRLQELQTVIAEKTSKLAKLKRDVANQPDNAELTTILQETTLELEIAKKNFEELVIGEVSLSIFEKEKQLATWQEELTIVIRPLLQNLRGLTEKPRQREKFKATIAEQEKIIAAAEKALIAIMAAEQNQLSDLVRQELKKIKQKWQDLSAEANRKKELASLNLAKLDGQEESWWIRAKKSFYDFAKDRGLTLSIALVVAIVIIVLFRQFNKFLDDRRKKLNRGEKRMTYRILQYTQRLLMVVAILISTLIVFFIRGDVLLLALMFIVIFAAALGLRNFLPQFFAESRLLLNIGGVREQEIISFNGIPWRVASINMFSILVNPEIRGTLRLPLSTLKDLQSRPFKEEKWFPSSIGDWVVDDQNKLYEVINQTPDAVELQSSQGTNKLIPSAEYFAAGFVNLTKSKQIRITGEFGLDYSLQAIALDEVPQKLQEGITDYFSHLDLDTDDMSCRVEFKTANTSSLDYLVILLIDSKASKHYYKIERAIQQACVKVSNEQGWTIPFPQLTVSKAGE